MPSSDRIVGYSEVEPKRFLYDVKPRVLGKGSSLCMLAHPKRFNRGFPQKSQPVMAVTESFLESSSATLRTVPMTTPYSRARCPPAPSSCGATALAEADFARSEMDERDGLPSRSSPILKVNPVPCELGERRLVGLGRLERPTSPLSVLPIRMQTHARTSTQLKRKRKVAPEI